MKTIIVPGEPVDVQSWAYTYKENKNSYSNICGILDKNEKGARIIPLKTKYIPHLEDYVVGMVTDPKFGGAVVDINSPYNAFMPTKRQYEQGDIVFAKITEVNEVNSPILSYDKKLSDGQIIEIAPSRIARVIGKNNSMIDVITNATKSEIFVGRNGRIFISGGNTEKAIEAIKKIEQEAHKSGLTNEITKFLGEKK